MSNPIDTERRAVLVLQEVEKSYPLANDVVLALRGVSFSVYEGEFISIMGQSGSGKSTLLHVLGCLHQATGGIYQLDDTNVANLNDEELSHIRNTKIGFVFQKFNLLPQEDIVNNVALPLVYAGVSKEERFARARRMLELVGLGDRFKHKPTELSGGQSQRVAIARALVTDPAVILADEPTGNLDSATGQEIMGVFQYLHRQGSTIIQVTHDQEKAEYSERIIRLKDGLIENVETVKNRRLAQVPELSAHS